MTKFLDDTGLTHFWEKIKATFAKKTDIPTAVSDLTNDEGFVTTDANVTQTAIDNTSTDEYRVLLSNTANDTTETAGVNKNTNLKFKPNGGQLTVPILKIIGSASANGEMSAANIKASATIGGRVFVGTYGENSTNILLTIDPDDGTITLGNDLINVIKGIKVKNATSAYQLTTIGDKRNVATSPNEYRNKLVFQGLKLNSSIGNPTTAVPYSYVVGLCGWADSSGGGAWEIAFNDKGIFIRREGTTRNTWANWVALYRG